EVRFTWGGDGGYTYDGTFEGLIPMLTRKYREVEDDAREEIEKYMTATTCPDCDGKRLKPEALAVTVADHPIDEVVRLQLKDAEVFFTDLKLAPRDEQIAGKILKEVRE